MRHVESAGILIKSGDKFLLCHASNLKPDQGWGIPKGRRDDGESLVETACRETFEECGLEIDSTQIRPIYQSNYRSNDELGSHRKTLHVFLFECDEQIQKQPLTCSTFFTPRWAENSNVKIPEVDNFKWVTIEEAKSLAMKSIKSVFDLF